MKSITKLSLALLTAVAFAAFPAQAQDAASTNTAPAAPRARAAGFTGSVKSVDATAMTLVLKSRAGDVTVKVTSDTKITKDREPAVFADAKEGLRVSGSGKKQDDGSWIANTLRISTKVPRPAAAPATPPPSSDQK
jgi:Cu/Ag efflux protein CusF